MEQDGASRTSSHNLKINGWPFRTKIFFLIPSPRWKELFAIHYPMQFEGKMCWYSFIIVTCTDYSEKISVWTIQLNHSVMIFPPKLEQKGGPNCRPLLRLVFCKHYINITLICILKKTILIDLLYIFLSLSLCRVQYQLTELIPIITNVQNTVTFLGFFTQKRLNTNNVY